VAEILNTLILLVGAGVLSQELVLGINGNELIIGL
jgi:hypothetical protein